MIRQPSLLLDTHIVLWWLAADPRLSRGVVKQVMDSSYPVYVSSVSIAEIAIKASIGKLILPDDYVEKIWETGFAELAFASKHAVALRQLPFHHRDPFDRMLIVQAKVEGLKLVSMDGVFAKYGVA